MDSGSKIFKFTAVLPPDFSTAGKIQVQAQEAAARICETGSASTDGSNTGFDGFQFALDDGNWNGSIFHLEVLHTVRLLCGAFSRCYPSSRFVPTASPKAATAKWSGAGLQFGYEFPEGDRFSLQLHNWKGGDIEVSSQMVVYDYFLSKNLYAGVGSGTIELKALGKTQSQRGSAINLGWQYSFSPSFKLELGYLLLSAEASITKEIKETRNVVISRAEVGTQAVYLGFNYIGGAGAIGAYSSQCSTVQGVCDLLSQGIMVTSEALSSEISQAYEITETQEVTVSNPSAIYIRLTVGF